MRYFLPLIAALLVVGCRKMPSSTTTTETSDSTNTVYRTQYIEIWRDTTIYIPFPVESKEVEKPSDKGRPDSSHLETTLAESDAWVDESGNLHHNLNNKPGNFTATIPVKDTKEISEKETTTHRKKSTTTIIREKYIPKWGRWCIGIAILILIIEIGRFARKLKPF